MRFFLPHTLKSRRYLYYLNAEIGRIEKRVDKERLEVEVADLKQRACTLQERVEDLEKRLKTFS